MIKLENCAISGSLGWEAFFFKSKIGGSLKKVLECVNKQKKLVYLPYGKEILVKTLGKRFWCSYYIFYWQLVVMYSVIQPLVIRSIDAVHLFLSTMRQKSIFEQSASYYILICLYNGKMCILWKSLWMNNFFG